MNVEIKVIPHKSQRYSTVGDWQFQKGMNLLITVSDMKNWKYEALIAVHELLEVLLCKDRKISLKSVDKFDMLFEALRKEGNTAEPGNNKSAPYYKEHQFATKIEKMLAKELKVNWKKYGNKVLDL